MIACRYAAPPYCFLTPLIPSQQSSLIGTRTKFACQLAIACTEAASDGPSKIPHPWMQAYSVPERLTPRRTTAWPPYPFGAISIRSERGDSASVRVFLVAGVAAVLVAFAAGTARADTAAFV